MSNLSYPLTRDDVSSSNILQGVVTVEIHIIYYQDYYMLLMSIKFKVGGLSSNDSHSSTCLACNRHIIKEICGDGSRDILALNTPTTFH